MTAAPLATPTRREGEVLAYLRQFTADHGYGPSIQEMCDALGLKSTSTVGYHLAGLAAKGWVKRIGPRALWIADEGEVT